MVKTKHLRTASPGHHIDLEQDDDLVPIDSIYSLTYPTITKHRHLSNSDGLLELKHFAGRVALVINVASEWGKTDLTYTHIKTILEKYSSNYKTLSSPEEEELLGQAVHDKKNTTERGMEEIEQQKEEIEEEEEELEQMGQEKQHENDLVILAFPTNDFHQEKGTNEDIEETVRKHLGEQFNNPNFVLFHKSTLHHNPVYKMLKRHMPEKEVRHNFYKYLIGRDGVPAAFYAKKVTLLDMIPAIVDELES